jgi:hypothetical protein
MGLVPSRGWWFGRLGSQAQQAQQSFPVLGLAEGIAGKGQASKGKEAEGSVGREPACGHRPGVKALRGLGGGGCASGLQLREEQGQAKGQRPPLPAGPSMPNPPGCTAAGGSSGAVKAHPSVGVETYPEGRRISSGVALGSDPIRPTTGGTLQRTTVVP